MANKLSSSIRSVGLDFLKFFRSFNFHVGIFSGGGLSIKLLKRTAHFGAGDKCTMLASSSHRNIKLLVPKKSVIFVEQTLREREHSKGEDD